MDINKLMKQAQQMQAGMAKAQEELAVRTVEASVGGGKVNVIATGSGDVLSIKIDASVIDPSDAEFLEDLVLKGVQEAILKGKEMAANEMSKLTGAPVGEDSLLYAIPVCAPYQTLSKYKYRIKLTPGNLKRGKAAKQCIEMFLKGDGDKSPPAERNRELMKRVSDNDWVQVMCSDVKISAPGANKNAKQKREAAKKGGKKG